jgi:hypothetical protein
VSTMFRLKTLGCSFESIVSPVEPLPPCEMAVIQMLSYLPCFMSTLIGRTDNLFREFVKGRLVTYV